MEANKKVCFSVSNRQLVAKGKAKRRTVGRSGGGRHSIRRVHLRQSRSEGLCLFVGSRLAKFQLRSDLPVDLQEHQPAQAGEARSIGFKTEFKKPVRRRKTQRYSKDLNVDIHPTH